MFDKLKRALSQLSQYPRTRRLAVVTEEDLTPPDGDAFLRQGLAFALGPEAAREVLAELDYGQRVAQMERLAELRRRELAANADLHSLR